MPNEFVIVHYYPTTPIKTLGGKMERHTIVCCYGDQEFDLELGYLEAIDTSPSSGWWMVPNIVN